MSTFLNVSHGRRIMYLLADSQCKHNKWLTPQTNQVVDFPLGHIGVTTVFPLNDKSTLWIIHL